MSLITDAEQRVEALRDIAASHPTSDNQAALNAALDDLNNLHEPQGSTTSTR